MQTIKVALEHCYGIKKLAHLFDFSQCNAIALYAPNGAMKTSLARTFQDLSEGKASRDRIFPDRITKRVITDENDVGLPPEAVFVITPYDDADADEEHTSTLLVNKELRKQHTKLNKAIDAAKATFLKALKEQSGGSKKDMEVEISSAFTSTDNQFMKALLRLEREIKDEGGMQFAFVEYDKVFDERVLAFLATENFKTAIAEYIQKYNELLAASTYFKRGIFNYYNAASIAKQLADHGFFEAKHSVNLNSPGAIKVILTRKDLETVIEEEKKQIAEDKELKARFDKIDKLLNEHANLRAFSNYLLKNPELLPHLENVAHFRQEVLKSYIWGKNDLYRELLAQDEGCREKMKEIEDAAREERTRWERVLDIFNDRFHVPFRLNLKNRVDVILGREEPTVEFIYEDGDEKATLEKANLLAALSTGEQKALYVLNIIFEVEARRQANTATLFVIDDIADSFDYKNKYAIIEYLQEIAEDANFKQILLTHNFDFYRTVLSRFVRYPHCLMAFKQDSNNEIVIGRAEGVTDVFGKDLKEDFFKDDKKRIACIPFMRNLIEYTRGRKEAIYTELTALLHWKDNSANITLADLDAVYNSVFQCNKKSDKDDRKVMDILYASASECLKCADGFNFEHKIVLAIAIRLSAERFMIAKINDDAFVKAIKGNQTFQLFKRFREVFAKDVDEVKLMQRVVLMTPESIHLNSFMYEPIIDMSADHLKKLMKDVNGLKVG